MFASCRRVVLAAVGAVAIAAAVEACGADAAAGPSRFIVTYRLDTTGSAALDSVAYDNGHGALVTVPLPTAGWNLSLGVDAGGTIEAHAWGLGAPASSAQLKATWSISGVSSQSDSSHVNFASPVHFTLDLARRVI